MRRHFLSRIAKREQVVAEAVEGKGVGRVGDVRRRYGFFLYSFFIPSP